MEIMLFEYPGCPYCRQAERIMETLKKEHPGYQNVDIKIIDETEHPEIADQYDYYYTPCFFKEKKKIYEADPSWSEEVVKEKLNRMFEELMQEK